MNAVHICGGKPLQGEITIQGSKNAALPILAATVLIKGISIIQNCPDISDVSHMLKLLKCIGCSVYRDSHDIVIDAVHIKENRLPKEYVTSMRSSVILMGALLARTGEVMLDYPGGCVIGRRPIDIHLHALRELGVLITGHENTITAVTTGLKGKKISFPFPSVGATENALLAAVLADGVTIIENAAREPEIIALGRFLLQAGAKISGHGTSTIAIEGVKELRSTVFKVDADRIVAGTYLFGTMVSRGNVRLKRAPIPYMCSVLQTARKMGADIRTDEDSVIIESRGSIQPVPLLETEIYPGFPSDLQSMLLVTLSLADGNSRIRENIFSNRFNMAKELNRMGALIHISGNEALVTGNRTLIGKMVIAEDLRGGAALILAGLCADGDTFITNYHFIERGYENICRDLEILGADIRRYGEETQISKEKDKKNSSDNSET